MIFLSKRNPHKWSKIPCTKAFNSIRSRYRLIIIKEKQYLPVVTESETSPQTLKTTKTKANTIISTFFRQLINLLGTSS